MILNKIVPNILSVCSGVDMPEMGLNKESLSYNKIGFCEINNKVADAHDIIWGKQWRLVDVTNISKKDMKKLIKSKINFIICSCPCQSFSTAGNGLGFLSSKGNVSIETMILISKLRPEIAVMENVAGIMSPKNVVQLTQTLDSLGYEWCYDNLNAKYFDVPQNRERCFIVLIRKDVYLKKGKFSFPVQTNITNKTVNDIIDINTSHRRSICNTSYNAFLNSGQIQKTKTPSGIIYSNKLELSSSNGIKMGHQRDRIFHTDGISPTITLANEHIYYDLGLKCLTAKERLCGLMGVPDKYYRDLKNNGVCETTISQIAGNGLVVDVFAALAKNIYEYMNW